MSVHGPRKVVCGHGHQPGRKRKRIGGRYTQALAILTCHLAGCGVGAPSMLRRECRRAGKSSFSGNIEGALPEGPASNGSRPTDRLILHGVVRDPVSKLSIRPFEIKRETPEAILASWILTILGRRRPPPRTMTFGPPGQPNNLIRSNRLCRGGKAVGLPSVLPVRVQGLTGIPGGAPADRRGDP